MRVASLSWLVVIAGLLALAASPAMAHEFIRTPELSGFVGKGGTQSFLLNNVKISCNAATIDGQAEHTLLEVEMADKECTSFSKAATVLAVDYLFTANNEGGIAALTKATVVVHPSAGECVYTLPEASKELTNVSYTNNTSGITISAALTGLEYALKETGTTACGTNGEKGSNGQYKGEVTAETYEGSRCMYVGWIEGVYKDFPGCSETSLFFAFYANRFGFTSLQWK